ncbi:MAG: hypothetical protein AAFU41_07055 [Pseudomonadota bacterium]
MRGVFDKITGALPEVKMPTIGKSVDVPVYVIHNSADAEDYFFIFDFEQFVERSRSGMFVRPRLLVWAGRGDFGRGAFARQFRESFAREFDVARKALSEGETKDVGWFGQVVGLGLGAAAQSIPGMVALIVLALATSAGGAIWARLPNRPRFRKTVSPEEKLEARIAETQGKVDAALAGMEVTLHRELYDHARKFGPVAGGDLDYDAWPLPDYVRKHLTDQASTSWW